MFFTKNAKELHVLHFRDSHASSCLNKTRRVGEHRTATMSAIQNHSRLAAYCAQYVRETRFIKMFGVRLRVLQVMLVVKGKRRQSIADCVHELVTKYAERVQRCAVSAKYTTWLARRTIIADIFTVHNVLFQMCAVDVYARAALVAVYYRVFFCVARKADLAHIVISHPRLAWV